ncbi:hypothetical protein Pcac1_g11392 [Phytophthora cactorum]|uniref:Uncharacterized protein n=1 Tax=Phytophthora cactorum TaxID=29920 RepID=A0A8T1EQM7_9STRA|nr:hypothetical protein Pcac1_g11392 [Phytophthora cactorum]KAG2954949.1 hypothetical protein PC117_g746 [Phytophthora cactorum]
MAPLQLSNDDYVCYDDSSIDAPIGITSDVELLVESAVSCFYEWTLGGRLHVGEIFALLDSDDDGSVSGQDSIAAEMTHLLCDSDNPSEEVTFLPFVASWIMLLDDAHVSNSVNEHRVQPALQQLFLA